MKGVSEMIVPKMTYILMSSGLDCNLACRYCYHGVVSSKLEKALPMSSEILSKIIKGASEISLDSTFLWHGGEPLMAGLSHFEEAIRLQKMTLFPGKVINILQSNMTLMSQRRAEFFVRNGFRVSTSLDGSKESHNANRIFPWWVWQLRPCNEGCFLL
ncbi:MAG: 4Fe-4S cluster-binding domain-containing protein [Patescibacteria group bacterium]|nr:4Fe-4S cluster-binding domain-containing protein [Patescibacteria group bacterium]